MAKFSSELFIGKYFFPEVCFSIKGILLHGMLFLCGLDIEVLGRKLTCISHLCCHQIPFISSTCISSTLQLEKPWGKGKECLDLCITVDS